MSIWTVDDEGRRYSSRWDAVCSLIRILRKLKRARAKHGQYARVDDFINRMMSIEQENRLNDWDDLSKIWDETYD